MHWYVRRNGETVGPVEGDVVRGWITTGMRTGVLRSDGTYAWTPLAESPFGSMLPKPPPSWTATSSSAAVLGVLAVALAIPVAVYFLADQSMALAFLSAIPVASVFLIWVSIDSAKGRLRREADRALQQDVEDAAALTRATAHIRALAQTHAHVLSQKEEQLVTQDDYGKWHFDRWFREVTQFADEWILPDVPDEHHHLFDDAHIEHVVCQVLDEFRIHEGVLREQVADHAAACVAMHAETLSRKFVQLVHPDEYGRRFFEPWVRELDRFAERVIMPELPEAHWYLLDRELVLDAALEALPEDVLAGFHPASAYRRDMTGLDYELLVEGILRAQGFETTRTPKTGDQGVDLVAKRGDLRIAVQCKRYQGAVGNAAVQQVVAGAKHYACTMALVVSDAVFTPGARQLANTNDVFLFHHDQLERSLGRSLAGPTVVTSTVT